MHLDKFNNPVFNETDVFDILYRDNASVLPRVTVEVTPTLTTLEATAEFQFNHYFPFPDEITINDFDYFNQSQWSMPDTYKTFEIEDWIIDQCIPWDPYFSRVKEELAEFQRLNMIDLLRWCKYFVDTCNEHNIVWGVGRGSSVASYILYLIGVHRIDSVKYNLDWHDFLR